MINGRNFSYEDIKIVLNGVPVADVKEINYKDAVKRESVRGGGRYPIGVGTADYEASGDITLTREDYDTLISIAAGARRKLYEMNSFVVVVAYGAKTEGDDGFTEVNYSPTHVDRLENCLFQSRDFAAKQGDTENTVKLELYVGSLKTGGEN